MLTLKTHERLKSRKIIEQLFKEGKSFSYFPLRVVYLCHDKGDSVLQAGVSVSTRYFKKAVDRNRVKRMMRECYRLQKNELSSLLEEKQKGFSVFFIYTTNELPLYKDIFDKMKIAISRLEKIVTDQTT